MTNHDSHAAVVSDLTVTYTHNDPPALNGLTVNLRTDVITGLVGRNGSGKTTLLSVLAGFVKGTSGTALVHGHQPWENEAVIPQICLIREGGDLGDDYKVKEVVEQHKNIRPTFNQERALKLVDAFRLDRDKKVSALSRGQRSALGVTIGLASRAPVTLFDEVHLGMDAQTRYRFYDELLADYAEHPRTIVLSSHLVNELERLIEDLIIVDAGRILEAGSADDFRDRGHTVTGPRDVVEPLVAGMQILARVSLGRTEQVTILGQLTDDIRRAATAGQVELGSLGLQDLVVHLTNDDASSDTTTNLTSTGKEA